MLDRYDCRGFLYELDSFDKPIPEIVEAQFWNVESSYDYDRYYDLYHKPETAEEIKSEEIEKPPSKYGAVGYVYDTLEKVPDEKSEDLEESDHDLPYFCPQDLKHKLPPGTILPETERKAVIIEQTSKFVAEKGSQMEIIIKTKQSNNKKFDFLNYDHKLNPFYRHVTQLIKTAQYIPSKKNMYHIVKSKTEDKLEGPSLVMPKVDINSTPYGKLVERFKIKQQQKRLDEDKIAEEEIQNVLSNDRKSQHHNDIPNPERPISPSTLELMEARQKMYEDLYQKYYPHYFQYYNDVYGKSESMEKIVAMSRDYAATTAANWIQNNMPDPNMMMENDANEIAVMRKMAEYVAIKGPEFEQMMLAHNGDKFGFLNPSHTHYKRYRRLLKKEERIIEEQRNSVKNKESHTEPKNGSTTKRHKEKESKKHKNQKNVPVIQSIVADYGSSSDDDDGDDDKRSNSSYDSDDSYTSRSSDEDDGKVNKSVCFKVTTSKQNSNILSQPSVDLSKLNEEEDYDFTEHLKSSQSAPSSSRKHPVAVHIARKRVSRFSPANPKNIIAMSAQNFDAQQQSKKRKAAQFLADKLMKSGVIPGSGSSAAASNGDSKKQKNDCAEEPEKEATGE